MTLHFPDVAHYQAGLDLAGYPAAIAKATQGTAYVDPEYARFRQQAIQLRLVFAAYHWVDTSDLQQQAAHAHAVIGSTPTMWDAEAAGATVPRLLDLTARYRALGGKPSLVYLPHWWWQQLGSPDLRPLLQAGLALVSSNYPAAGYSDNGPGWQPYGGVTPTIWQYTDKPFDMNAFKGTVAQLAAVFTGAVEPPEDFMATINQADWDALIWRTHAIVNNLPVVVAGPTKGEKNALHDAIAAIGTASGMTPAELAALSGQIATAVVDLEHDRLAS